MAFAVLAGHASGQWMFQRSVGTGADERAYSIEQTREGGYVTAGVRQSVTGAPGDIYVCTYTPDGSLIWDRFIGSTGTDVGHSVRQTTDGGYIVAAETNSVGTALGIALVRLDAAGGLVWSRVYQGTPFIGGRIGVAVRETPDGFAVVGRIRNAQEAGMGGVLIRTDMLGNIIFARRYNNPANGTPDTMSFADLRVLPDGFVVVGHDAAASTAPRDMLLTKISPVGAVVWAVLTGDSSADEESDSLENTSDGGFVFTARDSSIPAPGGTRFVKTDFAGAEITSRRFAGFLSAHAALREDIHSMLIVGGNVMFGTGAVTAASLARTFPDGTLDVAMAYGAFAAAGVEQGESAIPTSDCGYALAGRTDHFPAVATPEKYLVKTNKCLISGCNEAGFVWPDDKRPLPQRPISLTFVQLDGTFWQPAVSTGSLDKLLCLQQICLADFNCDGFVTGDDFDAFTNAFDAGDISADVNCDGFTTGDDFDAFTAAFDAGC